MDIVFPSHICADNNGSGHYYLNLCGSFWQCKFCWACIYIPVHYEQARQFAVGVKTIGMQRAYDKMLRSRPRTIEMLEKLEEVRLLRIAVPADELKQIMPLIITEKHFQEAIAEEIAHLYPNNIKPIKYSLITLRPDEKTGRGRKAKYA